jgi:hypothetical protein
VNRDQLVPLLLGFLAVLALGASAATLDNVRHGSAGVGGTDRGVGQGDSGSSIDLGSSSLNTSSSNSSILTPLFRVLFVLFLVVGLIALVVMVSREGWRSLLPIITITVVLALLLIVIYYAFDSVSNRQPGQGGLLGTDNFSLPSGGSLNGVTEITPPTPNEFSTVVFALLGVTILVAAIILVRATGDDPLLGDSDSEPNESASPSPTVESAAVGEAAGRAADRIETDTPLSNAIYSAWNEMTTHLDLSRETSTPGEFAEAAVASGMARDDVDELTELFEATRYGGIDASEEREQRALAALRRIEREYAGSGDGEK